MYNYPDRYHSQASKGGFSVEQSHPGGIICTIILLLSLSSATDAALVTAYSNFSDDGSYATFGNWVGLDSSGDYSRLNGSVFIPTVSGTVISIETGMFGTAAGEVTLSLHTDLGSGAMSGPLWEQTYSNHVAPDLQDHSIFSVTNAPEIIAGTAYWLIVDTPVEGSSYFNWNKNSLGLRSDLQFEYFDSQNNDLSTRYYAAVPSYAMSVSISSVPVPATVWLLGSGLLALTGIARRRKTVRTPEH
jgi:hypothetical protein